MHHMAGAESPQRGPQGQAHDDLVAELESEGLWAVARLTFDLSNVKTAPQVHTPTWSKHMGWDMDLRIVISLRGWATDGESRVRLLMIDNDRQWE